MNDIYFTKSTVEHASNQKNRLKSEEKKTTKKPKKNTGGKSTATCSELQVTVKETKNNV